ncbi:MAG: MFS transporter [Treponema sp.]|jgi:MFS family permease|nr:MFS transporter [Treponema sp.]
MKPAVFRRPAALAAIYRSDVKTGRFLSALILSGVAAGLYRGIQDNFLAEMVRIDAFERGIVEFFRELPGLFVVLILAGMYRFTENSIFKTGVALMAAGLGALMLAGLLPEHFFPAIPGKITVIALMVLYSGGEHIIMPVRSSISLDLARRDKGGASLGVTGALGYGGNIAGFLVVSGSFLLFSRLDVAKIFRFRIIYAASAVLMICAFLVSLAMKDSGQKVKRRRFYFARKFFKFYMLEVFYGARKQIFITFAPYVLILNYRASTQIISLLLAASAVCGFIASPLIGKLIDKVGYKTVMVTDTLILIVVCFFYGFSHRLFPVHIAFYVVCINYILDAVISVASMASNVYVQDIAASQEEITATISTGISVNHVISILVALLGGLVWKLAGIEILFSFSAFLGLLNSIYAATIKPVHKAAGLTTRAEG